MVHSGQDELEFHENIPTFLREQESDKGGENGTRNVVVYFSPPVICFVLSNLHAHMQSYLSTVTCAHDTILPQKKSSHDILIRTWYCLFHMSNLPHLYLSTQCDGDICKDEDDDHDKQEDGVGNGVGIVYLFVRLSVCSLFVCLLVYLFISTPQPLSIHPFTYPVEQMHPAIE